MAESASDSYAPFTLADGALFRRRRRRPARCGTECVLSRRQGAPRARGSEPKPQEVGGPSTTPDSVRIADHHRTPRSPVSSPTASTTGRRWPTRPAVAHGPVTSATRPCLARASVWSASSISVRTDLPPRRRPSGFRSGAFRRLLYEPRGGGGSMPRLGTLCVLVCTLAGAWAQPAHAQDASPPGSMAAIGDSITRATDACCWFGDHPGNSWSTGAAAWDGVASHYERLRSLNPAIAGRVYNDAVAGSKMAA